MKGIENIVYSLHSMCATYKLFEVVKVSTGAVDSTGAEDLAESS